MSYKVILSPIDGGEACRRALGSAYEIAKTSAGHIQALHVKTDSKEAVPLLGEGMSGSMIEEMIDLADRDANERARTAKAMVDEFAAENNIPITDDPASVTGPTLAWILEEGREDERIAGRGRVSDLIVMGQPSDYASHPSLLTLHAAIFETGRPVLMLPENAADVVGKNVVIAWNGASEAAGAVAGGMPLITGADKVTIVTVDTEKSVGGVGGEALADYLGCHGVTAECRAIDAERAPVGEVITNFCSEIGSDLLIMGAFTHSRLIQVILGGVTRNIIANANVPVLMIH
ncbi:MAG: universal stress protein [Rhodospirillaceae bacterium]|nr:universal stress protein [Rhodospirillaceae bacterium]